MTRIARILMLLLGIGGLCVSAARAGDVAALNILGFSADGSVFAFEEYGRQDGSGFPYANRFYIDTARDRFLPGSPIRVRINDDTAAVGEARTQAQAAGDSIVPDAELLANPGYTAGLNPVTESSADPYRMVVNPRPVFPPIDPPLEVRLETIDFYPSETCRSVADTSTGFRLLMINSTAGGVTTVLHEDSAVPASRLCPLDYRIAAVQTLYRRDAPNAVAVMIAIKSFGFEGPDYRYIAVTYVQ
ncbi:DUF2259 domain-containing protein [Oricola sp.]|uniref:DUF2259 domain-containing protein n=1 Tax=Oricola sp. TaxID=1979950 RepID=UPI003BA85BCE